MTLCCIFFFFPSIYLQFLDLTDKSFANAGPGVSESSKLQKVIFHPATGMCVLRKTSFGSLLLGPCSESEAWGYTPQKVLMIKGAHMCLQAVGKDEPTKLGSVYKDTASRWIAFSDSQLHLSSELSDGTVVCLDVGSNNEIVTSSCKCLTGDKDCDPQSQWFKIVDATGIHLSKTTNSLTVSNGVH